MRLYVFVDNVTFVQYAQPPADHKTKTPNLFLLETAVLFDLLVDVIEQVSARSILHQYTEAPLLGAGFNIRFVLSLSWTRLLQKTVVKLNDVWMA